MTPIIVVAIALIALAGTLTVFTPDPTKQALMLSIYGLLLGVLFVVLSAPDVALSQIAVGSAIVPLIVMLSLRKINERQ